MLFNTINFRHNETFDKLNCEGFEIVVFNWVPLGLFVCVRHNTDEETHAENRQMQKPGCESSHVWLLMSFYDLNGYIFTLTCEIASRFAFMYIHLYVLCVSILKHTVWTIPTYTHIHSLAKPKLAHHFLQRTKLSASWLPQARLYLTAPTGGPH